MTFSASGAAPTPLYQEYQSHFGLTPFMVTVIFATYVLCLLLALLTVGSLSDFLGRRPAILGALAMNIVAMLLFMTAGSAAALIVARAVQGFATGLAVTALGATILDTDRDRAPMLNSVTAFAGLSAGTLGAGVLVTFAPAPEQLVFFVLLALSLIEAAVLWFMPETSPLTRREKESRDAFCSPQDPSRLIERLRLRGLSGARDEFHLAAIVQNLKTMALRLFSAPPDRATA
jgi:MFS family permease